MDIPLDQKLRVDLDVRMPLDEKPWNIGLVTGPSGAGKSLLAEEAWPQCTQRYNWPEDKALIDGFPVGVGETVKLLTAVGLGSVPAWVRPYSTLSTGEAFRADVARAIAETPAGGVAVIDEYSSVVDRHVARVASHALQKAIRKTDRRLIAVTCHEDVLEWLQPDWVVEMPLGEFAWRSKRPHPPISLQIHQCSRAIWPLFARYHYLSASLHTTAKCFGVYCDGRPVAFSSYRHFPHPKVRDIQMAHRVVVLPDWQGLGIAKHLCEWQGQYLADRGYRYRFVTAHPGLVHYFVASPRWRSTVRSRQLGTGKRVGPKRGGMTARALDPRSLGTRSFEYLPVK
jgi:GNAT superfamily N-acetyltransferase